jgi:hypothetical protein
MDIVKNCDSYVEYEGCVLPKRRLTFTILHGVISETTELTILLLFVQKQAVSNEWDSSVS